MWCGDTARCWVPALWLLARELRGAGFPLLPRKEDRLVTGREEKSAPRAEEVLHPTRNGQIVTERRMGSGQREVGSEQWAASGAHTGRRA